MTEYKTLSEEARQALGLPSSGCVKAAVERLSALPPAPPPALRTFTVYRPNVSDATHDANQKNAADQPQFEGVVFSDGTVAIRWLTAKRSTAVWSSVDDMLAIHGHPEYGTKIVWHIVD